jgi:pectin methylesterase-like acyl-CoA thioesterase
MISDSTESKVRSVADNIFPVGRGHEYYCECVGREVLRVAYMDDHQNTAKEPHIYSDSF